MSLVNGGFQGHDLGEYSPQLRLMVTSLDEYQKPLEYSKFSAQKYDDFVASFV